MLYNLLNIFAIAETIFGTVLSVLCVLRMSLKDVMKASTYEGISNAWKVTLQQRHYARCGISFILSGGIVQILMIFKDAIKIEYLLILILITVLIPVAISSMLTFKYLKEREKDFDNLSEKIE